MTRLRSSRMTRSVVVFILSLSVFGTVKCRNQESYLNQAVNPYTERAESNATQNSLKFTRKYTLFQTLSTTSVWEVYTPTTSTDGQYEIARGASATPEYSNQFGKKTTPDELATVAGPSSSTNSPQEPSKFAVPYPEQNTAFSETVYRDKICKNEPTCHMTKLAPEELTHLGTRNCMCDEDCRKYGDCCLDSPYYNATEQRLHYQAFYCSAQELVYMVASCPQNYLIDSIKSRCGYYEYESANNDLSLMTPVTSTKYRITFANSYCALCNGIDSFSKWQVELKCDSLGPVEQSATLPEFSSSTSSIVIFPSSNRKKRIHQLRKKSVATQSSPETNAKEAIKYAKYDPKKKIFVSTYNGENFKCAYKRDPGEAFKFALRYCYPAIGECSDFSNRTLVQLCEQSATTIMYNKIKHYRNPECALCNRVKDAEPLGCFDLGNKIGASSLFAAGGNKGSSQSPQKFCDKLGQQGQNKVQC